MRVLMLLVLIHSITVKGPEPFRRPVLQAISFIQQTDPTLLHYITLIEPTDKGWSWIYGYDGVCIVELNPEYLKSTDWLYQVSGDLVHEDSLCGDYFNSNVSDVRADEIHALRVQRKFLIEVRAPRYLIDYMDTLIASGAPYLK